MANLTLRTLFGRHLIHFALTGKFLQVMQEQEVITIKVVRPNEEDQVIRLKAPPEPLTVSKASEELKVQLELEGSLQLDDVILESAGQLKTNCLYTLLINYPAGKYCELGAKILQHDMSCHCL